MSVVKEKIELRRTAKEGRSRWAKIAGNGAEERLKKNFFCTFKNLISQLRNPKMIAGYWPITDEIDVRPLILELHKVGCSVSLPVVIGVNKPLIFRAWEPGILLDDGGFGTRHPSLEQAEVRPGILLVPMLAFDIQGQRLGWGGGFYDRTISKLRAQYSVMTVGIAYQNQQVEAVPHTKTDEPLDWIVTDLGVLEITKK